MLAEESSIEQEQTIRRIKDIDTLTKLRLSLLVVIPAVSWFFFAGGVFSVDLVFLLFVGLLITGASYGTNQSL